MLDLPRGPWGAIVADPPWPYATPGGGPLQSSPAHRPSSWQNERAGSGSVKRYGAMSLDDLCAMGVDRIGSKNAHLYLWTTNAFVEQAHRVARAWGFSPKTVLTWVKTRHDSPCTPSMKTGYYFRGATEHVLFCVRGSLRLKAERAIPTAFLWPRLPHSVKPAAFYGVVEEASPGPYLELFARRPREGWTLWGNEAPQVEIAS